MKNETVKRIVKSVRIFWVIVATVTFAIGFAIGHASSPSEETALTRAFDKQSLGDSSGTKALMASDKNFWVSATYPEKVSLVFGFRMGHDRAVENMGLRATTPTYGPAKVVEFIDEIYTKRVGMDEARLMPMLEKAIWYE